MITDTSANFDTDTLARLFGRIASKVAGLPDSKPAEIMSFVRAVPHDAEGRYSTEISLKAETFYLGPIVSTDDTDAPDVEFWGSESFISMLEAEHEKLCDELGNTRA